MDDKIPYIAFEAEMARHERIIKRLLVALLVSVALLFASNAAWLWFFNQFDFETETVMFDTTDGGMSSRRGRDRMGRFTSRDASEMSRKLREMMEDAPDDTTKREIQRLADRVEQM